MAISAARLLVDITVNAKDAAKDLDAFGRKLSRDFPGQVAASRLALVQLAGAATGVAGVAISSLTSGLLAFTSAAAPAVGAAAGFLPIMTAVGQGAGVAMLAFQGVGKASENYLKAQAALAVVVKAHGANSKQAATATDQMNKALEGLTPSARAMAVELAGTKKPIDDIRSAAQAGLFPGVTESLHLLIGQLPAFRGEVQATGAAMGGLAVGAATTLAQRQSTLQSIMQGNIPIITNLGRAGTILANALITVVDAAMPLGQALSRNVLTLAQYIGNAVQAGAESGRLAAFMQRGYETAQQLGRIMLNLGETIFHVFQRGTGAGQTYLDMLDRGAASLNAWSTSAKGLGQLDAWYARGITNNRALAGLIAAVGAEFHKAGEDGNRSFAPLVDQISNQLVPALGRMFRALSDPKALSSLITSLSTLATVLSRTGGTLDTFAAILGTAVRALDWLTTHVPGATEALGLFLTLAAGRKALGLIGLGGAIDALTGKLTAYTLAAVRSATVDFVTGFKSSAAAANAATGAFGTLGGALSNSTFMTALRNPGATLSVLATQMTTVVIPSIVAFASSMWGATTAVFAFPGTWIVLGLVALGAALFVAYKKSETFRDIVNGAWAAVQNAVGAVVDWFTGTAIPAFTGAVTATVNYLKPTVMKLVDIFSQPLQGVIRVVQGGWLIIHGVLTGHWGEVADGIARGIAGILQLFLGLPVKAAIALVQFTPTLLRAGGQAMSALEGATTAGIGKVVSFLAALPGRVWNALADLGEMETRAAKWFAGLLTGARDKIPDMLSYVATIPGRITSSLGGLGGILVGAGADVVAGLAQGIANGFHFITAAAANLRDRTISAVKGAFGIGSPAKTMMPLGGFTTEGFAVGMVRQLGMVEDAAGSMLKAATVAIPAPRMPAMSAPGARFSMPDPVAAASMPQSRFQPGPTVPGADLAQPGSDGAALNIGVVHFHGTTGTPAESVAALSWYAQTTVAGRG